MDRITCRRCGVTARATDLPPAVEPWGVANATVTWRVNLCRPCAMACSLRELMALAEAEPGGTVRAPEVYRYTIRIP